MIWRGRFCETKAGLKRKVCRRPDKRRRTQGFSQSTPVTVAHAHLGCPRVFCPSILVR